VAAAERLLTTSGPGSVSMDGVAAAAGAGKMSAYRHFASKGDLVAAALERHNPRHVRWLVGARQAAEPGHDLGSGSGPGGSGPGGSGPSGPDGSGAGGSGPGGSGAGGSGPGGSGHTDLGRASLGRDDPMESILSAFDQLESAAGSEPFRGCPFVDAALAAPGTDDRPGRIAWRHKRQVTRELAALAARAGLPEPEELGAVVALMIDGAAVQAALAPDAASRQQIVRRGRRAAGVLLAVAGERVRPGRQP
jgi:AcrR family transcriptional regulator